MTAPAHFFRVSLPCADEIELTLDGEQVQFRCIGSLDTIQRVAQYREVVAGRPLSTWPRPEGRTRGALLLKRLVLEAQGCWRPPYSESELCHCRAVPTETVLQAITMGAHDAGTVSEWTSASTSCGTCRPDVENLLKYMLSDACSLSIESEQPSGTIPRK